MARALTGLIDRFCGATVLDADLIRALFVTAFMGGRGGIRPAFAILADEGRGKGKSTLIKMLGLLVGGAFDLQVGDDAAAFKKRLLTPDAQTKRVVAIDNIKTEKFSWGDLEAMITAAEISGHQMYSGERTRPNTLLWILTLNGPAMSKDMAQRCVPIKLGVPNHDGPWEEETAAYIEANRWHIIGDIAAFYDQEPVQLEKFSRWAAWEKAVLARLPEPEELQRLIAERQAEFNADDSEIADVEDYFSRKLASLGYEVDVDRVHIPSEIVGEWISAVLNKKIGATAAVRMINQAAKEVSVD